MIKLRIISIQLLLDFAHYAQNNATQSSKYDVNIQCLTQRVKNKKLPINEGLGYYETKTPHIMDAFQTRYI
jgi:hypothetical protein